MPFLHELSKRLKTDLGEIARASVDKKFADKLATQQFEQQRHDRDRAEQLEDKKNKREEELLDAETERRFDRETEERARSEKIFDANKKRTQTLADKEAERLNKEKVDKHKTKVAIQTFTLQNTFQDDLKSGNFDNTEGLVATGKLAEEVEAGIAPAIANKFGVTYQKWKDGAVEKENIRKMTYDQLQDRLKNAKDDEKHTTLMKKRSLEIKKSEMDLGLAVQKQADLSGNKDAYIEYVRASSLIKPAMKGEHIQHLEGLSPAAAKVYYEKLIGSKLSKSKDPNSFQNTWKAITRNDKMIVAPERELNMIKEDISLIDNYIQGNGKINSVDNKRLTARLMELSRSRVRAFAELQEYKNMGALDTRVLTSLTNFFEGERSMEAYRDIRDTLSRYHRTGTEEVNKMKALTYDQNEMLELDPEEISGEARYVYRTFNNGQTWLYDKYKGEAIRRKK